MRCIGLRMRRPHLFAMLAVAGSLGCDEGLGGTLPDQIPIVTDSVQTSAQYAAAQVLAPMQNMEDGVAGVFQRTGDINLDFHDTNDNLPSPYNSQFAPYWPPDSVKYVDTYQNYAATYHDTLNYRWAVFYVTHNVQNRTDSCDLRAVYGLTNVPRAVVNQVQSSAAHRWSFIFATDIQLQEDTLCTPHAPAQWLENLMTHLVAHEFGHQRAGLTDNTPNTAGLYHQGTVPKDRQDVMISPFGVEWYLHPDPVFDAFTSVEGADNFTCKGNLLANQNVH